MGLLEFLAVETFHLCQKLHTRIWHNRRSQGGNTDSGIYFQSKLKEVSEIMQQAEELAAIKNDHREAHIYIIFAKVGLEAIIKDKQTPVDVKEKCETVLCDVLNAEKEVMKSATRVVRTISCSQSDWKTEMEGITKLNQIVTLLDRLLYMNPADDLANQFLKSHCDVNLQPEIEKKRQIVKKEFKHFFKKL